MRRPPLTVQVLFAVTVAIILGVWAPSSATAMKPLGDLFINLIKMVVSPIIFCTVAAGISSLGNLKKVGRIGGKALLYFEIVTTLALFVGLLVANVIRPGDGVNVTTESNTVAKYVADAKQFSWM